MGIIALGSDALVGLSSVTIRPLQRWSSRYGQRFSTHCSILGDQGSPKEGPISLNFFRDVFGPMQGFVRQTAHGIVRNIFIISRFPLTHCMSSHSADKVFTGNPAGSVPFKNRIVLSGCLGKACEVQVIPIAQSLQNSPRSDI